MQDLNEFKKAIDKCNICFQNIDEKIITYPWGNTVSPNVMVVGESPSLNPKLPKRRNALLITPTGSMLGDALDSLSVKREQCYFTNVIKCAILSRIGNPIQCRAKWLNIELTSIEPSLVLALGSEARDALREMGYRFTNSPRIYYLPHPSFAMRDTRAKEMFWSTIQRIKGGK